MDNAGNSAVDTTVQGAEVVIPTDLSDPVNLWIPGSDAGMTISLPFSDKASSAEVLSPGIVSFNNNNTSTAAVTKDDGSLVIATVIDSSDAPDRYTYTVNGAPGSSLQAQTDGTVFLMDEANENILGGFLPAWARDAAGNDVPTRYEITGSELTQIVDLSSPDIVFPVVADPQAGYTLLEGVWKNRPGGYSYGTGSQWSTRLSAWGATVWASGLVGHQTVKTQGWVEWVNGLPRPRPLFTSSLTAMRSSDTQSGKRGSGGTSRLLANPTRIGLLTRRTAIGRDYIPMELTSKACCVDCCSWSYCARPAHHATHRRDNRDNSRRSDSGRRRRTRDHART